MSKRRAFYLALRPATKKTIHDWAEGAIYFGTRQPTARPGPYRASLTPYIRGIFDALRDPMVSEVVVKKSAQIGLTQAALIWLAYIVCEDPGPCLFVSSTAESIEKSTRRFIAMIEDSKTLLEEVRKDIKYPLQKNLQMFNRANIDWVSPTPSQLASIPVRYLILDETNKYKLDMNEEGDTLGLAMQRTKTYWNRKILLMSTPITEDKFISKSYAEGDQRLYLVPCPKCGHKQVLKFDRLKFDAKLHPDEAGAGAWYECENTCRIEHADKVSMMDAGEWVATKRASRAGIVSFQLSSMYSPFMSWAEMVTKFLTVKDDPAKLQDFINSDLGEDWVEKRVATSDNQLAARELDYAHGTDPVDLPAVKEVVGTGRSILVCSIDVQKDHFWVMVKRYWEGGHSALVSFARMFSEDDIKTMLATVGTAADEVWCGIDTGHKAKSHNPDDRDDSAIYDMCLRNGWIATKGASGRMGMPFSITQINPFSGTAKANDGQQIELVLIDTHAVKALLCQRQVGEGWGRWWIPKDAPNDYRLQVTAEQYNDVKGEWEIRHGRRHNHATDCEIIADVVARIAQVNQPKLLQTR